MTEDEMIKRLAALKTEHRDLDTAIAALEDALGQLVSRGIVEEVLA